MTNLSPEQQKYFAWLLTCKKSGDDDMRLAGVLSEAKVDLNPHQVEKTFSVTVARLIILLSA